MGASEFMPEWGPHDEEAQAEKERERLNRKVAGIFGAMGGGPSQPPTLARAPSRRSRKDGG